MLKKKLLSLSMLTIILVLVLSACGAAPTAAPAAAPTEAAAAPSASQPTVAAPADSSSSEVVTLEFWNGFNGNEVDAMNKMIEKYWNPTHPNIKVVAEGNKPIDAILTAMSGGEPPDVVIAPAAEMATLWAKQGAIMDLSSAVAPIQADMESELVPAGLGWVKYDGKYYGIPFVNFNWGLFYNKDLFKEAGLDPEKPPKTFDEVADYAKKLTKVDANGNITQLGWMPLTEPYAAINTLMAGGGQFVDANGNPTFNDPNIVKTFQWDVSIAKQFGLDKVMAFTSGFTAGNNPFQMGKVAMYVDGVWQINFLQQNAPDLKYGVAAIPYADPKYAESNDVGTNPIVVPTGSKHPKEAMEFALFMGRSKEISSEFSAMISNLPQIKSELGTFTTDPNTKFFANLSNSANAKPWAPVPYSQEYETEIVSAIGQIYNNGVDPQQVLDNSQKVVEAAAAK
jgi:multiple sugar transport system substrate-binding protein